jgi:hypothetical protein
VLRVDYIASGSVRRAAKRLLVQVELTETRSARIVWTESFDRKLDDAFLILNTECILNLTREACEWRACQDHNEPEMPLFPIEVKLAGNVQFGSSSEGRPDH